MTATIEVQATGRVSGNIFAVLGAATDALKKAGKRDEANELTKRVVQDQEAGSYHEALGIIEEYVTLT